MIRFPASALPLAIASGADAKAVQTMLGHQSATLTLDLYSDRLDVFADAMELTRAVAVSRDAGLVRDAEVEERPTGPAELASD